MSHYHKRFITCLMTTRCNLRCKYCLTSSVERAPMDLDLNFAKKAIKEHFDRTRNYKVRFYAVGEPTQNIEGIKEIVNYSRSIGGGVFFEMITNGIFNHKIADWLAENINRLWISYDGPPEACDQARVTPNGRPATEKILDTIEYLTGKKASVGVGLTVSSKNLTLQTKVVEELRELNVDCITSKAVLNPVGKLIHDEWAVDIMDYAKEFLKAWRRGREIGVHYTNDMVYNFDGVGSFYCRACEPMPHLTPDGYVSSCDRACLGDTPLQELIYGKWNAQTGEIEYWEDKIKLLQSRRVENMSPCNQCEIRHQCCGHCLGTTAQHTGSIMKPNLEYCQAIKFLHSEMSKEMRPGEFWPPEYAN